MDRTKRKIAAELLHNPGRLGIHAIQDIWRISHTYRGGLTDKECAYLNARYNAIQEELDKLRKLRERLEQHG